MSIVAIFKIRLPFPSKRFFEVSSFDINDVIN